MLSSNVPPLTATPRESSSTMNNIININNNSNNNSNNNNHEDHDDNNGMMLAYLIRHAGDREGHVTFIPKPTIEPGFALIRVLRAGVCNTDLEILQGYMGFTGVLGHEFVGIVQDVNSGDSNNDVTVQSEWIGQRVCGDINVGCDNCWVCHRHHLGNNDESRCPNMSRNHCPYRTVLGILNRNGTMAEYLTLPIRNLHKVPDHVSDEEAVFAEPLAAACRIVEQNLVQYYDNTSSTSNQKSQGQVCPDKVAILGDGKLGLMIAEVLGREHAKYYGCATSSTNQDDKNNNNINSTKPILFGKHRHKLDLVKDVVDTRLVSECQDETTVNGVAKEHASQYDVVVEATGSPAGLSLAARLCRPMGTLVLKSTCASGETFHAAPFVIDELKVVGR
jgi:threonine dehydrogenase-like Zn-dependent dehydrogenase